jgi:hypothetical protein
MQHTAVHCQASLTPATSSCLLLGALSQVGREGHLWLLPEIGLAFLCCASQASPDFVLGLPLLSVVLRCGVLGVLLHPAGEFQEVVDVKLRHTHPRVQKQRAAAANLAAATAAATAAASVAASMEEDAVGVESLPAAAAAESSSGSQQAAEPTSITAAAAAAASSGAQGIQVVQVLPWADAASPDSSSSSSQGEVLLELDNVSINTPDGGLALVQNLSLKVSAAPEEPSTLNPALRAVVWAWFSCLVKSPPWLLGNGCWATFQNHCVLT